VCTNKNQLFFFEAYFPPASMTQFREESRLPMANGYALGVPPTQIIWDGDLIYIASKKNYMIMDYTDGQLVAKYELVNGDVPMMSVYKDKCLVVTRLGKEAQFLLPRDGGILQDKPYFDLEAGSSTLVSIQLVDEQYVVAVFDNMVKIFKASTGDLLQTVG
jgi:hypothetical protein